MKLVWKDELRTGVSAIDDQHRELFSRLNTLLDACARQKGKEDVGGFLAFLEEYVVQHFAAEERAMTVHNFFGLSAHRAEHEMFRRRISGLKRAFSEDGASVQVVDRTIQASSEWLLSHIQKTDKDMAAFLRSRSAT